MVKVKPKPNGFTRSALYKPVQRRMEQGSAAITVRNQLFRGQRPSLSMLKSAGIKPRPKK